MILYFYLVSLHKLYTMNIGNSVKLSLWHSVKYSINCSLNSVLNNLVLFKPIKTVWFSVKISVNSSLSRSVTNNVENDYR
jgi:hypothetical protein